MTRFTKAIILLVFAIVGTGLMLNEVSKQREHRAYLRQQCKENRAALDRCKAQGDAVGCERFWAPVIAKTCGGNQ